MSAGFDPNKSKVSDDELVRFLTSEINQDLKSVPGIGPAYCVKLAQVVQGDSAVETTYQLIGKFLALKSKGMSSKAHLDAFWYCKF
jgi:hypothetical protein